MQPSSLHEVALTAEKSLEQLATGLAQAGADHGTVATVTKMADVTRQIVGALGKGQEQTGDNQPPTHQPPPAPQHSPQQAMDHGVNAVHQASQQAAAQRQGY